MTELTQQKLKEMLHYDPETGLFTWKVKAARNTKIGEVAGCPNKYGYIRINLYKVSYVAHRLVWLYMYGSFPAAKIDHINGNGADNRIYNLRVANLSENSSNRGKQKNNKSGFKGVTWHSNKWRATISFGHKYKHLGRFDTAEEAAIAYDIAARELHGEFACVNFPICHERAA